MTLDHIRFARPTVVHWAIEELGKLVREASAVRMNVQTIAGATVVTGGFDLPGSLEAGRRIAEIALGGLGKVGVGGGNSPWMDSVSVRTSDPVLACLGSQHPGWNFQGSSFQTTIAGPVRALAHQEPIFDELGLTDEGDRAAGIFYHDDLPPLAAIEEISRAARLTPQGLTLIVVPLNSLPGIVIETARVLELTLLKVKSLGFPLTHILDGGAGAPLAPPAPTATETRARIHATIAERGQVHLLVKGRDEAAQQLAQQLPFSLTENMPMTAPAAVLISTLDTGRSFRGGSSGSK